MERFGQNFFCANEDSNLLTQYANFYRVNFNRNKKYVELLTFTSLSIAQNQKLNKKERINHWV